MCGICGFIRFKDKAEPVILKKMSDAIRHRGYDDEGFLCLDERGNMQSFSGEDSVEEAKASSAPVYTAGHTQIGMGFRRMSVIDLSYCGHQPMISADESLALTFNGEIYNYKELRAVLQEAGFIFRSASDTEVILHGYKRWGKDIVRHLNGMFAFAIYDHANNTVFIARDRLGIKPLFYHRNEAGITWASEIKAVLKAPWVKAAIDWQGLFLNYQMQTTPSPYTCFSDIHSLEPASRMEINLRTGDITKERYWYIPLINPVQEISEQEAIDTLDRKLQQIVSMQLRSDVPVTSLMSGGIDSTTLTAICARQNKDFRCYTLGFDGTGEGADEIPQAREMAKKLGIRHDVHIIKPSEILNDLDATLRHFEEPYMSLETGVVVSEYLNRQGYKVVINGLGADEVFGGYAHYLEYKKWQFRKKFFFARQIIPGGVNLLPGKVNNYLGLDTIFKYFINTRLGMRPYEIKQLSYKEFKPAGELLYEPASEKPQNVPVSLFYYDLKYYIGSHHVYRDDLSSMKYHLESRYPYLDHELIEWVSTLPLSLRFDGKTTKPLLRKVSERYITPVNLNMPKRGFNIPLEQWMKEDNAIQDYTYQKLKELKQREIFNESTIEKWWKLRDESVYFARLWQLVTTEVWLNEYIEH